MLPLCTPGACPGVHTCSGFVRRCFEAVRELIFESEGEITGLFSVEGEKIPFMDSVNPAVSGGALVTGVVHCNFSGARNAVQATGLSHSPLNAQT